MARHCQAAAIVLALVCSGCLEGEPAMGREVRELIARTCQAGGPDEQSGVDVQRLLVSATWSCAARPAWPDYLALLDRNLQPYRRRMSGDSRAVYARTHQGDSYTVVVTLVSGSPARLDVRFVAGPY